jgi:hypothetical protein
MAEIRRARVLAALLLFTVTSWLATALSLVEPVVAAAATALLGADLLALRAVARRRQALRRQPAAVPRGAGSGAGSPVPWSGSPVKPEVEVPADDALTEQDPVSADGRRPAVRRPGAPLRRTLPPAAARRPAAHRVARREAPAAEAGLPTSDGTWMPVPVPPPTYTLKPMAPRPEPPALELDNHRPAGASADEAAAQVTDPGQSPPVVVGAEGVSPPAGPVLDRYEGGDPSAAQERPARRPWDDDREWADELDLDAVLARRRAVNG